MNLFFSDELDFEISCCIKVDVHIPMLVYLITYKIYMVSGFQPSNNEDQAYFSILEKKK